MGLVCHGERAGFRPSPLMDLKTTAKAILDGQRRKIACSRGTRGRLYDKCRLSAQANGAITVSALAGVTPEIDIPVLLLLFN